MKTKILSIAVAIIFATNCNGQIVLSGINLAKSDHIVYDTAYFLDTIRVDNIIFADSLTGIIFKKMNKVLIRKTTQFLCREPIEHFLPNNKEIVILYDEHLNEIDWISFQICDRIYSRISSGHMIKYAL